MEGIKRALEHAMDAQMRLVVVDISEASVSLPPLLARLDKRPSLIVLNKADLLSEHLTKKVTISLCFPALTTRLIVIWILDSI